MKLVPVRDSFQVKSLDKETRNALWNTMRPFMANASSWYTNNIHLEIWTDLYGEASDTVPNTRNKYECNVDDATLFYRFFRSKVIYGKWNECLDLIEFIANEDRRNRWNKGFYDSMSRSQKVYVSGAGNFNALFEKYMVGYRFVNGEITPITNENEIASVESAINEAKPSVQELLSKALRNLSSRANPDYAKAVDCSISAVEAQCCILLGEDNVTLGDALKRLENRGVRLHPALKDALSKLYGYTSNDAGVRHGTISPSDVDQNLAKFMLVACSAFVNYLISKGGSSTKGFAAPLL